MKGKGLDVSPGYADGFRSCGGANRAFLPSEHGDHPAAHSIVKLNMDVLAFDAHGLRRETGGAQHHEQRDRFLAGCFHWLSRNIQGWEKFSLFKESINVNYCYVSHEDSEK